MTPTADRLQTEKRRRDTIASDRELIIAGKKQRTHIQSHADEHPWPPMVRSSPELQRAAALTCAPRVLDGKLPAKDDPTLGRPDGIGAPTILAMLGLRP